MFRKKKTMKMSPTYYSRMTVDQLKRIMKERKLTTGGRKADLVERIVEAERGNMECTRTHTGHYTSVSDSFIKIRVVLRLPSSSLLQAKLGFPIDFILSKITYSRRI